MSRLQMLVRKAAAVCAAGVLLQTGTCAVDINSLAAGLVSSVASDFVNTLIFGAFNLVP